MDVTYDREKFEEGEMEALGEGSRGLLVEGEVRRGCREGGSEQAEEGVTTNEGVDER